MIVLILEIFLLVAGIKSLVTGKFLYAKGKTIEGGTARICGLLYTLPLPIAFASGFIITAVLVVSGQSEAQALETMMSFGWAIEIGVLLLCAITANLIARARYSRHQSELPPQMTVGGLKHEPNTHTSVLS